MQQKIRRNFGNNMYDVIDIYGHFFPHINPLKDQLKWFWNICHSNRTAFGIHSCAISLISASFYSPRFCIIVSKREMSITLLLKNSPYFRRLWRTTAMTYKHGDCDDVIIRQQWSLRTSLCLARWAESVLMRHQSLCGVGHVTWLFTKTASSFCKYKTNDLCF